MKYDPKIHHRRSIRLKGFDYSQNGAYFITICSHNRECVRINEIRGTSGAPVWQRNYHEHIIRNEKSLEKIREYVIYNPQTWEKDSLFSRKPFAPYKEGDRRSPLHSITGVIKKGSLAGQSH